MTKLFLTRLASVSALALIGGLTMAPAIVQAEDCLLDRDNDGVVDAATDNDAGANSADNDDRLACGRNATATGAFAVAIGSGSDATGTSSIALGGGSQATTARTIAIGGDGEDFRTTYDNDENPATAEVAIPGFATSGAIALGTGSMAIGVDAFASQLNSLAIGASSRATGENSIANGTISIASRLESIANGFNSNASAIRSIAIGTSSTASGENSTASGALSAANG